MTPDAGRVVVACGSPYYHQAFRTADLSDDGRYTTGTYPNAVAIASDGVIAAGSDSSTSSDVYLLDPPQLGPPSPARPGDGVPAATRESTNRGARRFRP
ncbi:hypothetical protein [Actinomadura alba]|uniref:Uncharacterized protein n=1 Tax=Actinomadura alba TaxID=406431 RepID=A0ABR7LZ03_9ACTN|nr:hypothetical protein [Actinomadura alba]MBC6470087.1 hypothetical protein [Actinomadura alba]